ncbi:Protein dgcr6 [Dissostichus eleginoides]|nr:Protein dgcr6 [Dissostichus eleginoides]
MDVYPGVTDGDPAKHQERHYYLLSELQTLVKDLPSSFQQRLSYSTLGDLALALIDGTVYEIVQGLLDIQHLTEKNLYTQRQKLHSERQAFKQDLLRKHKDALQTCKSHNLTLLKSNQQTELEALEIRVREEQRVMDKKIVAEMDQKVIDQQNTLEKAGVPGFFITTNPQSGSGNPLWADVLPCCCNTGGAQWGSPVSIKVTVPLRRAQAVHVGFIPRRTFCSIIRRCIPATSHSSGPAAQMTEPEQQR